MRADCPCGEQRAHRRTPKDARALVGSSLGIAIGIAAALLPKCPLCIAAYLSVLGVGTAASHTIAPLLFPIGIAVTALSLVAMVVLVVRRRGVACGHLRHPAVVHPRDASMQVETQAP